MGHQAFSFNYKYFQYKKNTINLYTTHSMILLQHVDKGLPLVQLLYNDHYPAKVITIFCPRTLKVEYVFMKCL
jgi:hypothetical protein